MRTEINAEKIMRIEFFSQLKDKSGATDDFLGIGIAFGPMNHSVTAYVRIQRGANYIDWM